MSTLLSPHVSPRDVSTLHVTHVTSPPDTAAWSRDTCHLLTLCRHCVEVQAARLSDPRGHEVDGVYLLTNER